MLIGPPAAMENRVSMPAISNCLAYQDVCLSELQQTLAAAATPIRGWGNKVVVVVNFTLVWNFLRTSRSINFSKQHFSAWVSRGWWCENPIIKDHANWIKG